MNKIASLKGTFSVMLPGQVEPFRFDKLRGGARSSSERGREGHPRASAAEQRPVGNPRAGRLRHAGQGPRVASHLDPAQRGGADQTPDKQSINFAGLETTRQTDSEIGVAYLFDVPDITGHTFIYKTPTVLMNAAVPYELHEIAS